MTRYAILFALALGGCVTGRATLHGPDAKREWPSVLTRVEAAAGAGRYAEAERLLTDFAMRYPDTDEAQETAYWRGVFKLDPANRDGAPSIARMLLEGYLRAEGALQHRTEAEVLRQLAVRIETLSSMGASPGASPITTTDRPAELKAKDAEIQKLKEELAKANDELERIKRRLAQPAKP